jgi:hypothetical protein
MTQRRLPALRLMAATAFATAALSSCEIRDVADDTTDWRQDIQFDTTDTSPGSPDGGVDGGVDTSSFDS